MMYEKGGISRPIQQRPVIAYVFLQSKSTTKSSISPVNGSARPLLLKRSPLQRLLISEHQTTCRDLFYSINKLHSTNDVGIGECHNWNLVEYPHTFLEREGGAKLFGNGIWRHNCASIKGQAKYIVPQRESIVHLVKSNQIAPAP
jgi:hypothetical protein